MVPILSSVKYDNQMANANRRIIDTIAAMPLFPSSALGLRIQSVQPRITQKIKKTNKAAGTSQGAESRRLVTPFVNVSGVDPGG